jgi:dienelactone hydrolase
MKFYLLVFWVLLLVTRVNGQISQQRIGTCTVFSMPFEDDVVTFAIVSDSAKLTQRKPILVFRQGSLPIPLFAIDPSTRKPALTELPSTFYENQDAYHIVMIAKPGVPLVVEEAYLDTLFSTMDRPKQNMYTAKYYAHNYLDYYVRQTNTVLDFVLSQPWADTKRVVVIGGSEGYHVSIKTAHTNSAVTHLIAFSGLLDGRIQGQIRQARAQGLTGEITPEDSQRLVESFQQQWEAVCKDSLNTKSTYGDSNRTIFSFSHGQNLSYLLSLSIPICVIYGTADIAATANDILPLEFARRGKTNLTLKAYPAHDHTFHRLVYDDKGHVTKKEYNGLAVQRDYFNWLGRH